MGLSPGDDVDVTVSLPEMVDYPRRWPPTMLIPWITTVDSI